MKKKTDKELGVVLPESMVDTIDNKALTDAQIGQLIRMILWNSMEYSSDIVVTTLARTLINTYKGANSARIKKIKASRESKKEYERKRREKANIVEDAILKSVKENMELHGIVGKVRLGNNNTPIIPLVGDEKHYSAKGEGGAGRHAAKNGGRPSTARPSKLSRAGIGPARENPATGEDEAPQQADGTKRPKGGRGPTAAPAEQATSASASRGAASSVKKNSGGRCRWTDAEGFCTNEKMQGGGFKCTGCYNREPIGADGAAPAKPGARTLRGTEGAIKGAAQRMMEAHPNSKSSLRAVVRAIAATAEDEDGDAADTLRKIEEAHTAWRQTDGWAESQGQYVQALAAWIRNGGWCKLPPQKKKTAEPRKGDEMSFGASL